MSQNRSGRSARTSQPTGELAGYRGAGVYPVDLKPIARPGDHVELLPQEQTYKVDKLEPVPAIDAFDSDDGNDIDVSANDTESNNDAVELQMRDGVLGQLRMVRPNNDLPTGLVVTLDQGGAQAPMWETKQFRGYIDEDISDYTDISALNEIYVWQDEEPKFTFENTTGGQLTAGDIRFAGFMYHLEQATPGRGIHVEPVPVESLRNPRG